MGAPGAARVYAFRGTYRPLEDSPVVTSSPPSDYGFGVAGRFGG